MEVRELGCVDSCESGAGLGPGDTMANAVGVITRPRPSLPPPPLELAV